MSGPAPQGLQALSHELAPLSLACTVILASLAALCGALINFEAAYCCEVSAFSYGIPRVPCAGAMGNGSRNSSGSDSV